jgi:hypothetical protein
MDSCRMTVRRTDASAAVGYSMRTTEPAPALSRRLLLSVIIFGLISVASLATPLRARPLSDGHVTHVEAGSYCVYNNRKFPPGARVSCTVRPEPNAPCRNLLGVIVLWTCRDGRWFLQ